MFGSVALEVGIGLVLSFSLFSVLMSSVREAVESMWKTKAKMLEASIGELLKGGKPPSTHAGKATLIKLFYDSPLISPMFLGDYKAKSGKLPSYIPAASFAAAVVHLDDQGAALPAPLGGLVQRLVGVSAEEGAAAQAQLEAWYESAMDRVSGSYKRRTQAWLFVLSFAVAAVGNINPIAIGDRLASDQQLRAGITALASTYANGAAPPASVAAVDTLAAKMTEDLTGAGLPIGWRKGCDIGAVFASDLRCYPAGGSLQRSIAGWLVAAIAAMLGAPFWFDLLNKLVNLRSAIKPGTAAATTTAVTAVSHASVLSAIGGMSGYGAVRSAPGGEDEDGC